MNIRYLALGAALAALAPAASRAAPLVQNINGLSQDLGDFTPFDINFLPFDPAQGTLASITLELIGVVSPELFSDNTGNLSSATLITRLFVFPTNGFLNTVTVNVNTQTNVPVVVQGASSASITGASVPVDQSFTFTDVADFQGVSATPVNLIEYGFRASTTPAFTGAGSDLTSFSGRAVVTYNLAATPVPEPAAMLTFGAGMLGLGWVRRRHG